MNVLQRARRPIRRLLVKLSTEVEEKCQQQGDIDLTRISELQRLISKQYHFLQEADHKIRGQLAVDDVAEDEEVREYEEMDEYEVKYIRSCALIERVLHPPHSRAGSVYDSAVGGQQKTYKLPKIELRKFSGDIKEWLGFWSQFSKVHDDPEISESDKFQYLSQSMVKGSRAAEVVSSYPQSPANYAKAIEALKRRFGKESLLVEVYVRELLKIVIQIASEKGKTAVSSIFDKLEAHLRALDSLGVTNDKCAAILFPLVESCLPEETLKAWHRSSLSRREEDPADPASSRLSCLMEFLREEVEGEERISLARQGFGLMKSDKKKSSTASHFDEDFPTAHGLVSSEEILKCIFCGNKHESGACRKALKMKYKDKRDKVTQARVCYVCLLPDHHVKACKAKVKCDICSKRHFTNMCSKSEEKESTTTCTNTTTVNDKPVDTTSPGVSVQMTSHLRGNCVLLQTLLVKVRSSKGEQVARLVIDTGSQRSYVKKSLAEGMELRPVGEEQIQHVLFGGSTTGLVNHKKYNVTLSGIEKEGSLDIVAVDQPIICGTIPRLTCGPWLKELAEQKIWISDCGENPPDVEILIGSDYYSQLMTGKSVKLHCGLMAQETVLGWTVIGPLPRSKQKPVSLSNFTTTLLSCEMKISDLWSLDVLGIEEPSSRTQKEERELSTMHHFQNTVQINEDNRYEVELPWTGGKADLPTNRIVAEKRLHSVVRKLKEVNKLEDYEAVFQGWLQEGIIEEVTDSDEDGKMHYLPHRAVIKNSTTTPVRPVYDASCKVKGKPSLNDCLEKGQNLLELIPSLLHRFRQHEIGVISDIRKAFLMISVHPKDRDFLRFLWWEKGDSSKLKVFRHRRVVFGLNCSPFLLGAVIDHHLKRIGDACSRMLLKSLYVDNCVTSVKDENELVEFMSKATEKMKQANMELRLWEHTTVGESGVGSHLLNECGLDSGSGSEETPFTMVLGMKWDKKADTIFCDSAQLPIMEKVTRRTLLSTMQRIYDPLGLLTPAMLIPKKLLQQAWQVKLGWDDELPVEISKEFKEWLKAITSTCVIRVPRFMCYGLQEEATKVELHCFCDASKYAYAAVVYLRSKGSSSSCISLLQSKSRIAPLKPLSIPRLELMACVIGSRLTQSIKAALDFKEVTVYYWSDSSTAISWIQRHDQWGTFVSNRVKEIRQLSEDGVWCHVPGLMNPADLPSRGCSMSELAESKWWEGPLWLHNEEDWPTTTTMTPDEKEVVLELRKSSSTTISVEKEVPWYMRRSNDYSKIVRSVAWILRFIRNLKEKIHPRHQKRALNKTKKYKIKADYKLIVCASGQNAVPALTVEEVEAAERKIIEGLQSLLLPDKVPGHLELEKKDGLLHVKTKIVRRDDTYSFRFPVVLPSSHPFVDSLIRHVHLSMCHAGVQVVMTELRERFWILRSRRTVRKVLSRCLRCQRHQKKHFEAVPAPLPESRVSNCDVFDVIGVDVTGPAYIKDIGKGWILLFTCAYYRAVHLELMSSLSTGCFLQALERFISIRGRPRIIYSDNATNFTGADNALRALNWDIITRETSIRRIQWRFNPPAAPWFGGFYERLIGMVKKLLVRVLGSARVNYEDMTTLLMRATSVINSRPLTYVSEDGDDLVPLTPAHFLYGIRGSGMPDIDTVTMNLQEQYRHLQVVKEALAVRFRKEHLSQLVQRAKDKKTTPVKIGDIVLIGRDDRKRQHWPMGKVEELLPGKDGIVRVVRVKVQGGELIRPIQRLFHLEVDSQHFPKEEVQQCMENAKKEVITKFGRVVRAPNRL